jgi:D-lactate dehydrogenase
MEKISIAFFDAKPYDKEIFDKTNEKFGFDIKYYKYHISPEIVSSLKNTDTVCLFVNDRADAEVIVELEKKGIRLIAQRSAGYNNIDLEAAYKRIKIVHVPAYSPQAVAEYCITLMLALNRKVYRAYFRTRDANFSLHGLMGFDMYRKTAGVIGTGKIGKALIDILLGFHMNVMAYDAYPDLEFANEKGFRYVDLDTLLRNCNIISLNCPLNSQTEYIINEESIEKMKDGVMIINTGRGKLIKTTALIEGLKSGKIGAAGLDVYEEESDYFYEDHSDYILKDDNLARLLTFNNVVLTSHQAFFTREALQNIAQTTLQNIFDFFEKNEVKNEVLKSR